MMSCFGDFIPHFTSTCLRVCGAVYTVFQRKQNPRAKNIQGKDKQIIREIPDVKESLSFFQCSFSSPFKSLTLESWRMCCLLQVRTQKAQREEQRDRGDSYSSSARLNTLRDMGRGTRNDNLCCSMLLNYCYNTVLLWHKMIVRVTNES